MDYEEGGIERTDTALRMAYSLLFALIISVLETVVGALVVFQLLYTLVTKREPSQRVCELGNRISTYFYRMLRYLTHNSDALPFPFNDFPDAIEAPFTEGSVSEEDELIAGEEPPARRSAG